VECIGGAFSKAYVQSQNRGNEQDIQPVCNPHAIQEVDNKKYLKYNNGAQDIAYNTMKLSMSENAFGG
jgi:hypothetical protein